jgi:hypothetical protein
MAVIVTREVGATAKNSPLTNAELDNNFINLNEAIGSGATTTLPAGVALSAGNLVNIYNDTGTARVRKAEADLAGREAHGFVAAAVNSGSNATVYLSGVITGLSGLTPGVVFLSETPGAATSTVPTTSGSFVQKVGVATSATTMVFNPGESITLA